MGSTSIVLPKGPNHGQHWYRISCHSYFLKTTVRTNVDLAPQIRTARREYSNYKEYDEETNTSSLKEIYLNDWKRANSIKKKNTEWRREYVETKNTRNEDKDTNKFSGAFRIDGAEYIRSTMILSVDQKSRRIVEDDWQASVCLLSQTVPSDELYN